MKYLKPLFIIQAALCLKIESMKFNLVETQHTEDISLTSDTNGNF